MSNSPHRSEDNFLSTGEEKAENTNDSLSFLREMIAHRPGGENRPQQETALNAIHHSIEKGEHLLIQAGTGTGKSFATLIPAIVSGKRVVYSTATKQLSEQIIDSDIPALKKEFSRQGLPSFSATLLKGRENYLCLKKFNELKALGEGEEQEENEKSDSLFELEPETKDFTKMEFDSVAGGEKPSAEQVRKEFEAMHAWAETTDTGDRSFAPPVSETTWKGFSVTNSDCVGRKACPYADECFSEAARAKAIESKVIVTNHAITALDLDGDKSTLLGNRDVYIFDEIHELDSFISNSWGTTVSVKLIHDTMVKLKRSHAHFTSGGKLALEAITETVDKLTSVLENNLAEIDHGLIYPNPLPYNLENTLKSISTEFTKIVLLAEEIADEGQKEIVKRNCNDVLQAIFKITSDNPENVVWVNNEARKKEESKFFNKKKKDKEPSPPTIHCAPIRIGPKLMEQLEQRNATMVGTSATITVQGSFKHPIHNFGFDGQSEVSYDAMDAGTPFDYSKQTMLYVPDPSIFPAPIYPNIQEHSSEVEGTVLRMVEAIGGRSLILTTTTRRINEVADHLEKNLPRKSNIKVLRQGSMPAPQLIEEFIKNETAVLVATMGMWHGLNAEGATCMLVVMDKIPFPTFDDPLMTARKSYADTNGGNGFMDVYVASANVKLAQGFGRLIRTMRDRGVVAILDTRMKTKQYGSAMLRSFPQGVRQFNDENVVIGALNRLREAREKELEEKAETPF